MLKFLKQESNLTTTENGAVTHRSTFSECLDLFAVIGALRQAGESDIIDRFLGAYYENPDLAMKILFYARDVRGGLGERRVFRLILKWLSENEPRSLEKNIPFIAEYGRFDDLLILLGTPCEEAALSCIKEQLNADLAAMKEGKNVSLLAKWLPSVNASSEETVQQAKHIARCLGMNDAEYRKTLSALRRRVGILENNLREKDYTFDYAIQPSKAMLKYRKAFTRNDKLRYETFLARVAEGKVSLHTGTLAPYEVIRPIVAGKALSKEERNSLDVTWNALENFTGDENALVVVDGSGSMYCGDGKGPLPAEVALSLGIYFAQRNTGVFHNHFITFSQSPRLVEIKGHDICDQVNYCRRFNEVANTDIQKVFELILNTAVKYRLPGWEMPKKLYIISDMEFDYCAMGSGLTNFEYAKNLYEEYGYSLPEVIFWNVASRRAQQPVTKNEQGVALVSGCNPRIFAMLKENILSPYAFMMEVLNSERYAPIAA